jgi:hypothetical protein
MVNYIGWGKNIASFQCSAIDKKLFRVRGIWWTPDKLYLDSIQIGLAVVSRAAEPMSFEVFSKMTQKVMVAWINDIPRLSILCILSIFYFHSCSRLVIFTNSTTKISESCAFKMVTNSLESKEECIRFRGNDFRFVVEVVCIEVQWPTQKISLIFKICNIRTTSCCTKESFPNQGRRWHSLLR